VANSFSPGHTQGAVNISDEDPSNQSLGSSITYRIAVEPQLQRFVAPNLVAVWLLSPAGLLYPDL
jgi:hypothetical protein